MSFFHRHWVGGVLGTLCNGFVTNSVVGRVDECGLNSASLSALMCSDQWIHH